MLWPVLLASISGIGVWLRSCDPIAGTRRVPERINAMSGIKKKPEKKSQNDLANLPKGWTPGDLIEAVTTARREERAGS